MRKFERLSNKELAILNKAILDVAMLQKIESTDMECAKELHKEIAGEIVSRNQAEKGE